MPRARTERRYLIEIRDAKGSVVFTATASWEDKDKRSALAQIERLARLPEVNFHTGRSALQPQPEKATPRRGSRRVVG
jgi:hypothetical protein